MVEPRELIARYIDEQAAWRRQMAERYPDDARNRSSAECLEALARHVRSLNSADFRVEQLWALDNANAAGTVWSPGPSTAQVIAEYGFHGKPMPTDAFLDDLIAVAEGNARDMLGERREWHDADD
jgi:hypothetical protein